MGEDDAILTSIRMREEAKLPFLASIVESSDDAIIGMTLDGIMLSWNSGAQEIYCYSAEEVIGKPISILAPPDRTGEIPSLLKRAEQGEGIKNFETVRVRKDGKQIDISLTVSPVKDADGRVIAISSIARDITERKRLEKEQRREKELSDALNNINTALNSTLDFDEIMRRVVIESMSAINAETSAILLLENNYWALRYFYGKLREQKPELVGIRFTYEQAKALAIATETAESVILSDAYNDKRVNTDLARKYQLRSIISIPLITREEVIGNISFAYHSAPVDFRRAEIDFSRKLATSVSLAVQNARLFEERKRVEEALKKERNRAQNYLNTAEVMMVVINADQKVALVNKKCSEVLGYSEQEITGRNWFDTFVPERIRDEVRAAFMKLIAGEIEPIEYFENPVLTREGTERLIAWHNAVLRDDAGNITSTLSSGEDITERRQIEEKLRESEVRYRTLFEQSPDGILIIDSETATAIEFNEIAHRQLGYTREEFKRLRTFDYEAKETPEETRKHIERVLREGRDDFETQHRTKDGKIRDVFVTNKTIELSGRVFFHCIFRDITERKQAEEKLKRSKELSDALNRINITINSTLDFDEIMQRVAIEATKAIGMEEAGILLHEDNYWIVRYIYGLPDDIIGLRFADEELTNVTLAAQTKKPIAIKDVYTVKKLNWEVVEKYHVRSVLIVPLIVKEKVIGIIGFNYPYSPITFTEAQIDFASKLGASLTLALQNARLTEERERWTAELVRSNAELEQLAYIASHDLQEPLRMISGFTQLLAKRYKGRLDKDADEFIAFIVDGTARMQGMIEDLLAYSRVGTRGKPFEPANLEDVFNKAVTNLKAIIEENRASVTHDPLPTVMADASQMVQLFQNLISNAIKFRKKEEPPRIHASAQRKRSEWTISVRDNGIGISPGFMGRLFQIFQREHPATEYPGTGIGLAICKRIVERHSGRIWAESEQGKGSIFHFTIPERRGERQNYGGQFQTL